MIRALFRNTLFLAVVFSVAFFDSLHAQTPAASGGMAWLFDGEEVFVKRGDAGNWRPIAVGDSIRVADRVRTGRTSDAQLLCVDTAEPIPLEPNSEIVLNEACLSKERQAQPWYSSLINLLFKEEKPNQKGGGRRGYPPENTILVYPRSGKILSAQPTFSWLRSSARPRQYEVRLLEEGTTDAFFSRSAIQDTVFFYPDSELALQPSRIYRVEVLSGQDAEVTYANMGMFSIATPQERAAILRTRGDIASFFDASPNVSRSIDLAYAAFLTEQRYYSDALQLLIELQHEEPEDQATLTLLAQIYKKAGPTLLIPDLE